MLIPLLVVLALLLAFGIWRRFGAIQWIWLLFAAAIALVVAWLIMLAFVIGPEMRRRAPQGQQRGMPVGAVEWRAPGERGGPAAALPLAGNAATGRPGNGGSPRPS